MTKKERALPLQVREKISRKGWNLVSVCGDLVLISQGKKRQIFSVEEARYVASWEKDLERVNSTKKKNNKLNKRVKVINTEVEDQITRQIIPVVVPKELKQPVTFSLGEVAQQSGVFGKLIEPYSD